MEIKGQLPISGMDARGDGAPTKDVSEPTIFSQALDEVRNRPGGHSEKSPSQASFRFNELTGPMSMKDLSLDELVELLKSNSTLNQLYLIANPR